MERNPSSNSEVLLYCHFVLFGFNAFNGKDIHANSGRSFHEKIIKTIMIQVSHVFFLALIISLWVTSAMAVQPSEIWPGLNVLELPEMPILGKPTKITIFYKQNLAQVINKIDESKNVIPRIIAIKTRLSPSNDDSFLVEYDEGPSADPGFIIYSEKDGTKKELFQEFGTTLILPGDGCVYLSGHINNYFDERKKFIYLNGEFSEVKQPFYWVGMKSRLSQPATLYSAQDMKSEIVKLPKDSQIEVVLNQGEFFLIKSDFSILGWLKVQSEDGIKTQMKNIFFAGD